MRRRKEYCALLLAWFSASHTQTLLAACLRLGLGLLTIPGAWLSWKKKGRGKRGCKVYPSLYSLFYPIVLFEAFHRSVLNGVLSRFTNFLLSKGSQVNSSKDLWNVSEDSNLDFFGFVNLGLASKVSFHCPTLIVMRRLNLNPSLILNPLLLKALDWMPTLDQTFGRALKSLLMDSPPDWSSGAKHIAALFGGIP